MSSPAVRAAVRDARAINNARLHPRCETCRTTRGVRDVAGRSLCYACRAQAAGHSGVELDHVAGQANVKRFVIALGANDHRTITEIRQRLGIDEWPEAGDDPLLRLAHVVGGVASLLILCAEWLVALASHLAASYGGKWWVGGPGMPVVA